MTSNESNHTRDEYLGCWTEDCGMLNQWQSTQIMWKLHNEMIKLISNETKWNYGNRNLGFWTEDCEMLKQ